MCVSHCCSPNELTKQFDVRPLLSHHSASIADSVIRFLKSHPSESWYTEASYKGRENKPPTESTNYTHAVVVYIDTSAPKDRMRGTRELRNLKQLGKKIRFQAFLLFFSSCTFKIESYVQLCCQFHRIYIMRIKLWWTWLLFIAFARRSSQLLLSIMFVYLVRAFS